MKTTQQKVQYNKLSYLKKFVKYLFFLFIFLLPFQTRYIYQQATLNPSLPSPQMGGNIAWEYGTLSLYATEILLGIIIILYIIGFITAYSRAYHNMPLQKFSQSAKRNLKNPLIFLPLALLLLSAASIFWSYDKIIAWNKCIILMEGIIVYLFILLSSIDKNISLSSHIEGRKGFSSPLEGGKGGVEPLADPATQNSKKYIFLPLLAGAILQSILAIYQFVSQHISANKWLGIASHIPETLGTSVVETPLRRWLRAYGSLPHPNILAAYLGIALLIFLLFTFKKSPEKNQQQELTNAEDLKQRGLGILKVFAIFIISSAIVFTFSRAAWIGLFICIIIFFVLTKFKIKNIPPCLRRQVIPSFGFFILFLFVLFLAREPILTRIKSSERLEQKSNQERILSYKESADIIKENWLLGTGIGNYTLALYKKNPSLSSYEYQPVHNLFMLILAELGILGLFIFLLFLFYIAKKLIKSLRPELTDTSPSSQSLPVCLSAQAGAGRQEDTLTIEKNHFIILFIFIFIISLFDHYFWSLYFGVLLFWISAGILTAS